MKRARARTDTREIAAGIVRRIEQFHPHCVKIDEAGWAEVETFVALALRVMARTNPSKIRDAAMIDEISARLDGRGVIE